MGGFDLPQLGMFAAMIAVMYFLIFLPKKKEADRMKKMLAALKKGDKVLTNTGMYGEVWAVKENIVTLRFHDNVRIDFASSAIAQVTDEKDKKKEEEKAVEAKA